MKTTGFFFLLFFFSQKAFSQSAEVTIGGSDLEQSYSLVQTSDNGYVIAGYTLSYGQSMNITGDVYLIKVNNLGNIAWTETVGGVGYDEGYGLVQATDGGFAVAGVTYSFGAGSGDMYLLKFTSAGALAWSRTLGGAGDEYGNAITVAADGSYIVAGYATSFGAGDDDMFLAKFSATGTLNWSRTFGSNVGSDRANSVIAVSDGYIMVGGTDSYGQGSTDAVIVKYNLSGTYQWSQTVGGAGIDEAYSVIQDTDGNLVFTGYTSSYGAGSGDMYLVKLDNTGNLLWTKTFGNAKNGWGWHLIQSNDGNYVVSGMYVPTALAASNAIIAKFDVSGNVLWEKNFGVNGGPEMANGLIQNNIGEYVMCGYSNSFGGAFDIYIPKFTSTGTFCGTNGVQGSSNTGGIASGGFGSNTNQALAAGSGGLESSGGTLTNQCGNLSNLPVELLSFYGSPENNSVKLSWTTASEENNDYFAIEHSTDGENFSVIGHVSGTGNSSSAHKYDFTDEVPEQTNYYRLSQTDFNGQHQKLGVVFVKLSSDEKGLSLLVQSNPITTTNLSLNLFSAAEEEVTLHITDLQGRYIRQEKCYIGKNENKLFSIDLNNVSQGTYFISATTRNSSINRKFLRLNKD